MDVVFKEGMLYHQTIKFGKRTWRKIWMLLFKPSSSGIGRLELYNISDSSLIGDQMKAGWQKTPERKVVRLRDCVSIVPDVKKSCPPGCTVFYLKTMQYTYTFASTSSQDWISTLSQLAFRGDPWESEKGDFEDGKGLAMEDNDLYSSWKNETALPPCQYQVKIQKTEASRRCKLAGQYLVSPDSEALVLFNIKTGGIIYQWPYKHLRKFGQVEGGFSIEAGRRCMSGEGLFTFLTPQASQIFKAIAKECSVEREACAKHLSAYRHSFSDISGTVVGATANQITGPAVYDPADDSSDTEYQSVSDYCDDTAVQNMKRMSLINRGAPEKESEDAEESCHSMTTSDINNITKEIIYDQMKEPTPSLMRKTQNDYSDPVYSDVKINNSSSNLQTQIYSYLQLQPLQPPTPPFALTMSDQGAQLKHQSLHLSQVDSYPQSGYAKGATAPMVRETEIDDSDYIYSDVKKHDSFSDLQPELYSSLLPHSVSLTPPDALNKPDQCAQPRLQSQYLPAVDDSLSIYNNTEAQAVDELRDMGEEAEAISATGCNAPSEAPGSFKHRLAEIISKDLAKLQPPLPFGAGIPGQTIRSNINKDKLS